jgi:hypothetical protein
MIAAEKVVLPLFVESMWLAAMAFPDVSGLHSIIPSPSTDQTAFAAGNIH